MNASYKVSQTFETLGDPCLSTYETREEAEAAAGTLRREIADMVAGWETPAIENSHTGVIHEIQAWDEAAEIAGLNYDDNGDRTATSPRTWGALAGARIASLAVTIEAAQ